MRLQSDLPLGIEGGRVRGRHIIHPGEELYCSLSWAADLTSPRHVAEATGRIEATGVGAKHEDGQGVLRVSLGVEQFAEKPEQAHVVLSALGRHPEQELLDQGQGVLRQPGLLGVG